MTFKELRLCMAIEKANLGSADQPQRHNVLAASVAFYAEYVHLFNDTEFPFNYDDVAKWIISFRKSTKTKKLAQTAIYHGANCFWQNRGKGPCSDQATLGRLINNVDGLPEDKIKVSECMVECSDHSRQRGKMTVERYLACHKNLTDSINEGIRHHGISDNRKEDQGIFFNP